jgi:hypothetical protein
MDDEQFLSLRSFTTEKHFNNVTRVNIFIKSSGEGEKKDVENKLLLFERNSRMTSGVHNVAENRKFSEGSFRVLQPGALLPEVILKQKLESLTRQDWGKLISNCGGNS